MKKNVYLKKFYFLIGIVFIGFHVYTGIFGVLPGMAQRAVHLLMMLVSFYISSLLKNEKAIIKAFDVFCLLCGAAGIIYVIKINTTYDLRAGIIYTQDIIFGLALLFSLFVAGKRVMGTPLTIVVGSFVLYGFFGNYMPSILQHSGISLNRIIHITVLSTEGIFGSPLYAASAYIVMFIILGALFNETGIGDYFTGMATAAFGKSKGGPAMASVVASGFFGSISGSAIANVVGTGTFTIPLMKKCGFDSEFSGAVEASASTGGQIMPPIMGATAFLAAELLGITYISFAKAALFPAIMYYMGILFSVLLYARRHNLGGASEADIPKKSYIYKNIYLLIPLAFLIIALTVLHFSITKAGIWSLGVTVLVSFLSKESRLNLEKVKRVVYNSMENMVPVSIACAMVGIIIAIVMGSGLAYRLSSILVAIANGKLFLLLFLTMFVCIILGMGVPTTAAYLILAVLVAPALQKFGISAVASHLFIFYFGIISNITPPVALASYAAAGIAKSNPTKTGYKAFLLAISGFIIPYMFVYNPVLLLQGSFIKIAIGIINSLIAVYAFSCATQLYCFKWDINLLEALICAAVAFLLIFNYPNTSIIGYGLAAVFLSYKFLTNKRKELIRN